MKHRLKYRLKHSLKQRYTGFYNKLIIVNLETVSIDK